MNINNINTFSHNPVKDQSELVTAIPPHFGSNGHEVSIRVSRHSHVAVAEVRTAQDKRFVLPQTSILNVYKEGFQTAEKACVCIRYQDQGNILL